MVKTAVQTPKVVQVVLQVQGAYQVVQSEPTLTPSPDDKENNQSVVGTYR